jgi:predicted N-acetyltransferase YhbS
MSAREFPSIRALRPSDDPGRLTELIHAAYAQHAARGLRYWGTHQSVEDTVKRLASGQAFVAVVQGEYVGTITVRPPQAESPVTLYRQANTWSICQFAVAPSLRSSGLGKALHGAAVAYAKRKGACAIALDTAAPAAGLIAMYRAWGYSLAGECDWRPHTNYVSVLMSQSLQASSPEHHAR